MLTPRQRVPASLTPCPALLAPFPAQAAPFPAQAVPFPAQAADRISPRQAPTRNPVVLVHGHERATDAGDADPLAAP
ncbi:hypothetical protein ACFXEL_26900 [Streptomyces sp. NPDC059382]|uniref:hypothetical protein n=1 Tax=Streptomyces sp. NPDC059382 TaxID=3346816 RepID=UPI0036B7F264